MAEQKWQFASIVSLLGQWAWIAGIINGIIELIFAFVFWYLFFWYLIGAIILIFISYAIIRPKFSMKCAEQDWESLYGWILDLGGMKVPWMLIWGIIFTIFSWYNWGGLFVLLPALLLLFVGPRPYNWSE